MDDRGPCAVIDKVGPEKKIRMGMHGQCSNFAKVTSNKKISLVGQFAMSDGGKVSGPSFKFVDSTVHRLSTHGQAEQ
jgi:hypothetical protein